MAKSNSDTQKDDMIKNLETLLAKEIDKVAKLLKENAILNKKLEQLENQTKIWRQYFKKLKGEKKILCDRNKAMVVYGEIDLSEVTGSE